MDATLAFILGGLLGAVFALGLAYALYVLVDNALKMWGR